MLITTIAHFFAQNTSKITKEDNIQTSELEYPIYYSADDSIRFDLKNKKNYLFGNSKVDYQATTMKSEQIEIDYKNNLLFAHGIKDSSGILFGTPVFKSEDEEIKCEEIIYNLKNKKGKIKNITTKQGEIIVKGDKIKKDSNDVMYFKNIACIPCEFEDSKTLFRAARAKVIPNDKIVTGPMYLEIAGIPTPLALPFGYFPNTRKKSKSGLIVPVYGESPNLGLFLKDGGFYWAIGPKLDMQFRGDIYTFGSWALKNITEYNVKYKYNGSINLGYSIFNVGEKELPTFQQKKDFFIRWTHMQDQKNNPTVRFAATVNAGTNSYNQFNAGSSGQYLTSTFASNISFSKTLQPGTITINLRHNQNTQTKIVDLTMPEVTFNVNRFFPFRNQNHTKQTWLDKLGINYLIEGKSSVSVRDTNLLKVTTLDSIKYGIHHSLPISTNLNIFKNFTFTPSINLNAYNYFSSIEKNWDNITNQVNIDAVKSLKTAFDASTSGSLTTKVYGNYFFRSKKLKQIRHFIIPTLNFTYKPDLTVKELGFYKEVQKDTFGNIEKYSVFTNSIYGGPSSGKSGLLSLNVNNNLEAKIRQKTDTGYIDKKITLLQNLSIIGGYDFMATQFNLSTISITARTKVLKNLDILLASSFDPYSIDANGLRQNTFQYNIDRKIARLTSGNIAINAPLSNATLTQNKSNSVTNKAAIANSINEPAIIWNLNLYYKIDYFLTANNSEFAAKNFTQTLNISGDIAITKKWKLGYTSGYDFVKNSVSYTSVNIVRDLHCWEARIDWVPFGFRKRYSISLNLKTSMLRDIKIPRTREWYDNL